MSAETCLQTPIQNTTSVGIVRDLIWHFNWLFQFVVCRRGDCWEMMQLAVWSNLVGTLLGTKLNGLLFVLGLDAAKAGCYSYSTQTPVVLWSWSIQAWTELTLNSVCWREGMEEFFERLRFVYFGHCDLNTIPLVHQLYMTTKSTRLQLVDSILVCFGLDACWTLSSFYVCSLVF